ncbi:MAG: hypothetical protein J0L88_08580 [Xanthomonadales bacterium]|nr:hypothetical protein [Xanthomonadales bacterium]
MYKNALAIALGLLAADAAMAQNTLSRSAAATSPTSVSHPMPTGNFAITQSSSMTIEVGNSVSCNAGTPTFNHTDNYYYRRFNLDGNFAATGNVTIASVDVGVEQATGAGGTQPMTVNLYAIPNASALTVANLGAAIGTASVSVADQGATVLNVPVAGVLNGLTHDLVVEVFTPDGQTAGNTFFIGSNTSASINPSGAPSFIRAPGTAGCEVDEPTNVGALGFPGMNIVMVVNATTLPVGLKEFRIE